MKFILSLAIMLAFVISCSTMSEKGSSDIDSGEGVDSLSFKAKKKTFANGLTAIVVENKKLPLFSPKI